MKSALLLIAIAVLAGCANLTPREQRGLEIAAGVLIVGAVAAHEIDHDRGTHERRGIDPPPCSSNPGVCQ